MSERTPPPCPACRDAGRSETKGHNLACAWTGERTYNGKLAPAPMARRAA